MKRTQIYLPELLHYQMTEQAKNIGISLSELLRQAGKMILQEAKKSPKKKVKTLGDMIGIVTNDKVGPGQSTIAIDHNDIYDL